MSLTKQPFDETYGLKAPENYERFFVPAIGEPLAKDLIKLAELKPGECVLDVACGTGIVARLAAPEVGEKGTVAGLDVNPGMLDVARTTVSPASSFDWYEASAEAMPLPDKTFDAVLCQLSLQFMTDKVVALQEMRRVLKAGGRLLFNVPGPASRIFEVLAEAMDQHIGRQAADFVNHVFVMFDTTEIQQLLTKAGFRNINVRPHTKTLHLPRPAEFLWQYIYSTPLAAMVLKADKKNRDSLEREVIEKWQTFNKNGGMRNQQRIVVTQAQK